MTIDKAILSLLEYIAVGGGIETDCECDICRDARKGYKLLRAVLAATHSSETDEVKS